MDDMKLQTKFNEGDKVWYFNSMRNKFYEGTIKSVNNWDKWAGFRYEIEHISMMGKFTDTIEEGKIFVSKQEILNTCFVDYDDTNAPQGQEPSPAPAN